MTFPYALPVSRLYFYVESSYDPNELKEVCVVWGGVEIYWSGIVGLCFRGWSLRDGYDSEDILNEDGMPEVC